MSQMHNPPHPGELIRSLLIDESLMTVTEAASALGVSRGSLSKIINCRGGISPEMAIRLSIALNTSAEMWLNTQRNYDLFNAEKRRKSLQKEVSSLMLKKNSGHIGQ